MSHRSTATSNLTDLHFLKAGLDGMGLEYESNDQPTLQGQRGRYGVKLENQHILVKNMNIGIAVDAEQGAVIAGDFYGTKYNEQSFRKQLQHHYMEAFLDQKLRREGWKMQKAELEGEESRFVLTRSGF